MKLFLNTTVAKRAVVSLIDQKGKVVATEKAEEPLIAIDRLLKKTNTRLQDLEEISAHPGPGSFTGLRVGATIAQTLNFALGKKSKRVEIKYE